ncbi:MAG TPA: glycerophosphodiester phosphodiesterase [Anaeromyxobacter sp.]|nr:glycerophosphodiester phosphodiesterase [Anaeromyxobacter sp.]
MAHRPYLDLPGPWIVAHRGGSRLAPENTLQAFERAAALGADAVEIDVRLTSDGTAVVFHDEDTARLTGEPGTIEGRPRSSVAALDAAFAFTPDGGATYPLRGTGVRIPTFAEALARFPRMRFNVDAKSEDAGLVEALAQDVRAAGAVDRVCVGSFFDAQAERLGRLLPGACRYLPQDAATCHVLNAKSGGQGAGCPRGYDLADLPHRLGVMTVVDRKVVEYFHARGMPVHVWTVDDEQEMRDLLAIGVDGIVTDRPDVLKRVLGR